MAGGRGLGLEKAVVLLSGGLDSATVLYLAKARGLKCSCLFFDYGQRHRKEISSAKALARRAGCHIEIVKIKFPWKGSALLDRSLDIPKHKKISETLGSNIPNTYVPARNIVFLSFALSYAETIRAESIFIGAHSQDYSGYPDCRPEFYQAFIKAANLGTKSAVLGKKIKIETPLIRMNKSQIIKAGLRLGVPFELTWSCYEGARLPCGVCDSCLYRLKGFKDLNIKDPLLATRAAY